MAPLPGPVFYPKYLDISATESARYLRQIEFEAYAGIISALRSQGDLTKEKKALLTEICACLGVGDDRHRAEIRRAVNDEKLSTIALHNSGSESSVEWIREGRRIVPLPHRPLQITPYMDEANRVAKILAAENAALPQPSTIGLKTKKPDTVNSKPIVNKPPELDVNISTRYDSSRFCAKCISLLNKAVDEETSTEDLNPIETSVGQEIPSVGVEVPSASDSYVYLPGGTRVCVAHGKIDKEDAHDAYSMKPSLADFGNAPDINLTGPRPSKRKRKKSSNSFQAKEGNLTIKQVIKPNSKPEVPLDELFSRNNPERFIDAQEQMTKGIKPEVHRYGRPTIRRKILDDTRQKPPHEPPTKSRKRKSALQHSIPHDTIQHTPVPPEHLYAAGSNAKLKHYEDASATVIGSRPEYSVSTQQSPTKHLGQFSSRISPLSPSYYPPQGQLPWTSSSSNVASRDIPALTETITTYSRGFRYSPTKSIYKPPNIVQNTYGKSPKAKRYRTTGSTYSFTKKASQAEVEHQSNLKQLTTRKDINLTSTVRRNSDDMSQATRMPPLRTQFHTTGSYGEVLQQTDESGTMLLPVLDLKTDNRTEMRSSSLEELASVSIMASAMSTSSIIETGLAPVSAIVSRVTSPAPGQLSSAPVAKKSNKPMILSRIQSEEGGQPVRLIQQPILGQSSIAVGPVRQGSTFVNVLKESSSAITPSGTKVKSAGSIASISGQHPTTHQVRLALSSPETNVPSVFSSSVPMCLSSLPVSSPRVISTVPAKSHTLLKSTAGNVITVTAKPLPGMKPQSTLVSGTSVVKPQIGQKTSIIVVHKAPGTKLGKNAAAGFQTISSDGSKVITVSTKNLSTPTIDLPRLPAESNEELASASALGSIQGLVSGLNPAGLVKKTKVPGSKPKFVTMPIHKKTIVGKIGEAPRAKVIQNVIRAPGKVLVRTSSGSTLSTGQLRTITGGRIVKPVMAHSGVPTAQILPSQTSQDIVAAALSHSLGTSTVTPSANPEVPTVPGVIKVSTSTPAASTIKAFAANYQKNTSTTQIQMKSLSSITTISPSRQERPKVFLSTSPSQAKNQPMLFTPNQPQVHRSPQATGQKVKPSIIQNVKPSVSMPQPTQHSVMKLKVLGTPQSGSQAASSQWQPITTHKVNPEQCLEGVATSEDVGAAESTATTSLPSSTSQSHPPAMNSGDRATFIYQYHPNTSRSASKSSQSTQMAFASPDNAADVIMLHSVRSNEQKMKLSQNLTSTASVLATDVTEERDVALEGNTDLAAADVGVSEIDSSVPNIAPGDKEIGEA